MAGELHEISRLLGQLESKLEAVVVNQATNATLTHARLGAIEDKIEPLGQVVSDHAKILAVQKKHDDLVQRGYGVILALAAFATTLGFVIKEVAVWGLRKLGFVT